MIRFLKRFFTRARPAPGAGVDLAPESQAIGPGHPDYEAQLRALFAGCTIETIRTFCRAPYPMQVQAIARDVLRNRKKGRA